MTTSTKGTSSAAKASRRIRLQIAGMSCGSCINHVRSAIEAIPGARVIDIRLGSASIELEPGVQTDAVVSAIAAAGYDAFSIRARPTTDEMSMTPSPAGAGGCCCGSRPAHQSTLLRPTRRGT